MSLPRLLLIVAVFLFGAIGVAAWMKRGKAEAPQLQQVIDPKRVITSTDTKKPQEVAVVVTGEAHVVKVDATPVATSPTTAAPKAAVIGTPAPEAPISAPTAKPTKPTASTKRTAAPSATPGKVASKATASAPKPNQALPEADFASRFFIRDAKQLPIVETIIYKSKVPWLQGRPAWLADYAAHYKTSRHFIARSLHGKKDYFKQDIAEGERINVLRPDTNLEFHLVVDVPRCKMWFYYLDKDKNEKTLVKSYDVGLGRVDASTSSGYLTPIGKYSLGDRTSVYRGKTKVNYNGRDVDMVTVFGTRWIPFDSELEDCTAPSRGLGIHGCPWSTDPATGALVEDASGIGQHTSDGCIRLRTDEVEELFSIIVSRPTTVELVRDFADAKVPGTEKVL